LRGDVHRALEVVLGRVGFAGAPAKPGRLANLDRGPRLRALGESRGDRGVGGKVADELQVVLHLQEHFVRDKRKYFNVVGHCEISWGRGLESELSAAAGRAAASRTLRRECPGR